MLARSFGDRSGNSGRGSSNSAQLIVIFFIIKATLTRLNNENGKLFFPPSQFRVYVQLIWFRVAQFCGGVICVRASVYVPKYAVSMRNISHDQFGLYMLTRWHTHTNIP